jgi:hypothetical protein
MAETMTVERCREVLTDSAEGQERCATQSKSAVAAASHAEHAAALRLALARLATLDAAREALFRIQQKASAGHRLSLSACDAAYLDEIAGMAGYALARLEGFP